jgi:hypothetical protein
LLASQNSTRQSSIQRDVYVSGNGLAKAIEPRVAPGDSKRQQ